MATRKLATAAVRDQLVASVLAAVTATVAGSYLGVNGTVIGAAVASVLTVVGNAVYSHSIHRTGSGCDGRAGRCVASRRPRPRALAADPRGAAPVAGMPAAPTATARSASDAPALAAVSVFVVLLTAV